MSDYDYIIVGSGAAGCVLAYRLTENPSTKVLLLEAGPPDTHPLIRIPGRFSELAAQDSHAWHYQAEPRPGWGNAPEVWIRGKVLGGTSSINASVYVRGQPQDYDGFEALGAKGWGWNQIGRGFKELEDHELGADDVRGAGGPLHISTYKDAHPFCEAFIEAGTQLGLTRKDDLNRPDQEGIGYFSRTIKNGRRFNAGTAFLAPAKKRSNLHIRTGVLVNKVIFEGTRAVGVDCLENSAPATFRVNGKGTVILSAGTIHSPKLLQLSGIGPAEHLRSLGIPVVHNSPGVGANLREHLLYGFQYRLMQALSHNPDLRGLGLWLTKLKYALTHGGIMGNAVFEVGAFVKSEPGLERADVQLHMSPVSRNVDDGLPEEEPGINCAGYDMRPESQGSIMIQSTDPAQPPTIRPNYLATDRDRRVSIGFFRYVRKLLKQPALVPYIREETAPGNAVQSDDEILDALKQGGRPGWHAVGTCKIGEDDMAVVDPHLRVRGIEGLRVMDCSVFPAMVSANTNAPVIGMSWHGAEIILGDQQT